MIAGAMIMLIYKILGTILEMDEGRISTNWPEGKKANDDA